MPLLLVGLLILAFLIYGSGWFASANPKSLVKSGRGLGVGLLLGLGVLLMVTGKFPLAIAALATAAGWGMRLMTLHNFYRSVRRGFGGKSAGDQKFPPGTMGRDEALAILGLSMDANDDEVRAAHRRLITGLHPDRGGSDFLAAQINRARDVLLRK